MKRTTADLNFKNDYFDAYQRGPVVVFSTRGNTMLTSTLNKAKESMLAYLDAVAAHPDVRVVVMLTQPRRPRREEYLSFFDMVKSARITRDGVMRLFRTIDQVIMHIVSSDLFFIGAACGEILPKTASVTLACDYRILGDNTQFLNPALELGLVAKGGAAWFLSQTVGRGQAFKYLLADQRINAEQALSMGLTDTCVPMVQFEQNVFTIADQFAAVPASSLKLAKRLVNYAIKDLPGYLEYENMQLVKAMLANGLL